jgi:iron complex outermembrane receptor protein
MKTQVLRVVLASGVSLLAASSAWAQQAPTAVQSGPATPNGTGPAGPVATTPSGSEGFDDIVVTARRREESAQTVPVSVTAFSGAALEQRGVRELQDLNAITPGFRFGAEGGKNNNSLILRGLGKTAIGEGVPAVVTYFADVALLGEAVNVPTYDLANIQVLKGPQGTLFGRNTLGGALLIKPEAPTYEFGGYARAEYGRFDYRTVEGAVNIPLVQDKVALRLAGQVRRQDGTIKNLSGGPDFNDIHQDSFRVSLLLEPFEGFSNLTIYDWFKAKEQPGGLYLYELHPGVVPGLSELIDPQLAAYYKGQRENGFFSSYSPIPDGGRADRRLWGITNDTKLELGDITVRNIFGYRESRSGQTINTGGGGALTLPVAPGVNIPFTLFTAASDTDRSYLSDEVQVLGTLFDDRLNFIIGGFYGKDEPIAAGGSNFIAFSATGLPQYSTSLIRNKNTAIFGQIGYKLTDKLTINLGARYSWDKVLGCGGAFDSLSYRTFDECLSVGEQPIADGVGAIRNKGDAPSWTIGLDYKASEDLFFYVTSRRGYRGVNINTPLFETQYTTGGTGCAVGTTSVPCPDFRPYQKINKEKLTDVEIGAKWDWTAGDVRGRLNVSGFYSKYKGALQFFNAIATGIPQSAVDYPTRQSIGINAADLTIKGIEFEATVMPVSGLTLSFNGAFTDTNVDKVSIPPIGGLALTKDDITKFTPKFSGTVAANWVVPVRPFDSEVVLNADYFHSDKFGATSGRDLPGYDLVNARLSLNDISGSNLSLAIAARNLFNEKYFISPSVLLLSFPTSSVYAGERRMWTLEAKYRF